MNEKLGHAKDFNSVLVKSIDETIANLLGKSIVTALHDHLVKVYDLTQDELPYRIDTLSEALQRNFGLGFRTIERSVARTFYRNLNLDFHEAPHQSLADYIEDAKRKLGSE